MCKALRCNNFCRHTDLLTSSNIIQQRSRCPGGVLIVSISDQDRFYNICVIGKIPLESLSQSVHGQPESEWLPERSWWTATVESFERLSAMLMFQGWAQENSTEKYNRWSSESSKQANDIDGLIPEACRNTNRYAILAITALINIVHESTSAKVMNSSNQSTWSACNYSYYHW